MTSPFADPCLSLDQGDKESQGNAEHTEVDTHAQTQLKPTDTSIMTPSHQPRSSDSSVAPRSGRPRTAPIPADVEIIDLESLPDIIPIFKDEQPSDDLVFIKSEPIEQSAFISFSNTREDAILIDDDEQSPPAPLPRKTTKENKEGASPHVMNVPMLEQSDESLRDALTQIERERTPLIEDEMEVDSAEPPSHAPPLKLAEVEGQSLSMDLMPPAETSTVPTGTNLDASILTPGAKASGLASVSASYRHRLRKVQQDSKSIWQAQRNDPSSNGRAFLRQAFPSREQNAENQLLMVNEPMICEPLDNILNNALPGPDDPSEAEEPDVENPDAEFWNIRQKLRKEKKKYNAKCAAGICRFEDEVRMIQVQSEHDALKKRRDEDRLHDEIEHRVPDHDSLFMDSGPINNPINGGYLEDEELDEVDEMFQKKEASSRDKRRAKSDEGNFGALFEAQLKSGSKGEWPKGTSKDKSKGSKGKKSWDQVKEKYSKVSKRSKGKAPKKQGPSMLDMGSLFTSDVIQAAQRNEGRAPLSKMTSGRRDHALKALVASVPLEHQNTAKVDKNYLQSACRDFVGKYSVRAHEGSDGWQVSGMTCILKHHQLLGAAFMRRRERGVDLPQGGICADQMGLGKTIEMLANIVNGRPPKGHSGPKTTLVVATPALCTQWFNEIHKHTSQEKKRDWIPLKCIIYRSNGMILTNDPLGYLSTYDIVVTTYTEVRRSMPKVEYPLELQTSEEKARWWNDYFGKNKGLLHQMNFLRIVLDEAQAIKNHTSWTSKACRALTARHRWALSGTPIQNRASELYPYFKFLDVPHTGSYKIFYRNFIGTGTDGSMNKQGLDRLNAFLSRIMIRRTHADSIMGAPIVSLPKASERIYWCKFNELERSVYEIVRTRMIQRINRLSRSRKLENNYSNVLTMLLRLRQLTGHILTLEQPMKDLLEREDHERIFDLAKAESEATNKSTHDSQMRWLRDRLYRPETDRDKSYRPTEFPGVHVDGNGQGKDDTRVESATSTPTRKDCSYVGRHHGEKFDFLIYLEDLRSGKAMEEMQTRSACSFCNDQAEEPWVTQCYHVYCRACLTHMAELAAARDRDNSRCITCGTEFTTSKPCDNFKISHQDLDSEADSDSEQELLRSTRRRGKKKNKESKTKDWIDLAGGNDILSSSKTLAIKAQILNWLQDDPNTKIIIYTQFIDMIRILSKVCGAEKWKFYTYHGGQPIAKREEAIKEFDQNPEMRILIASLKAGGIGLNLTMASRVIVVDPWWNSSVEQQAFCRVFRIGQECETSMTRFVVEKTVDENMIEMQRRKQAEIDQVIDGDKDRKLTITDLLQLFGDVDEDENGNPFILVDNRPTLPNPNGDMDDDGFDED